MLTLNYKDCMRNDPIDRNLYVAREEINPQTGKAYAVRPDGIWDDEYFARTYGESTKSGGDSVDLSQVPSVQKFVEGQFEGEDASLNNLIMQMRARQQPLEIFNELEEQAGLPVLRGASNTLSQEIGSLEDLLFSIEGDVSKRTSQSLATEAQRRGVVQSERKQPMENLVRLSTALGRVSDRISRAESGISTKVQLALRGQEQDLEPFQLQHTTLIDRNARRLSGFTEDRQTQLDVLFDKLERQRELSDREWELANDIAAEERKYRRELQKGAADTGISFNPNGSNDDLLRAIANGSLDWDSEWDTI